MKLFELFDNPSETHHTASGNDRGGYIFMVDKKTGKGYPGHTEREFVDLFLKDNERFQKVHDEFERLCDVQMKAQRDGKEFNQSLTPLLDEMKAIRHPFEAYYKKNVMLYTISFSKVESTSHLPSANWKKVPRDRHGDYKYNHKFPKKETFEAFDIPDGTYEFHFQSSEDKAKLTGTGNSVKVMSTVLASCKELMAKPEVKYVVFPADVKEPSRVKLYQRMVGDKAVKRWEHHGYVYWLIKAS